MKPFSLIPLAAAVALTLAACGNANERWEKADSDDQQLRSALYWCATQENREPFIKYGTSEQRERGSNTKTVVDEECMRKKGWNKAK